MNSKLRKQQKAHTDCTNETANAGTHLHVWQGMQRRAQVGLDPTDSQVKIMCAYQSGRDIPVAKYCSWDA